MNLVYILSNLISYVITGGQYDYSMYPELYGAFWISGISVILSVVIYAFILYLPFCICKFLFRR